MMLDPQQPAPLRPPMSPAAPSGAPQLAPVTDPMGPVGSGNPVLDEIHTAADAAHASLSPPAKEAVAQSGVLGGMMPPAASAPPPSIGPGRQDTQSLSFPQLGPSRTPAQIELQRKQSTGSGISQIHNPFVRTLASIGEGIGSALPITRNILPFIPGTEAHHQQLVGQGQQEVNTESAEQKAVDEAAGAESKRALEGAQAANQEVVPELKRTAAELAASRANETSTHNRATEDIARSKDLSAREIASGKTESAEAIAKEKHRATLAQHGFEETEQGEIVPLSYEKMSEPQQAVHDLKAAQAEAQEATAALKKAQAENQPAMAALAQKRLASAQEAHAIATRRLGLSEKQFEMRAHGTEGGEALPGAMIGDDNKPVGTAFQQNVRPTGQERNKADLATSAHEQLQDIKGIVSKRPDIFGPVAGRTTDFKVWLGSQDPDAQRFRAARTIAGDHLAGVFGGRSEAALSALDSAIGHFKDNPAAMQAGLDQLDKANKTFQKAGSVKTQGSNAGAAATADPHVKAYADKYFGGDIAKAQAAIDDQKAKK